MIIVVVVILVLIVLGLIVYNVTIHKKIQKFKNMNQKITNLYVVQDFMNAIGETSTVEQKIKKINEENEERAKKYGGEFGYVKAFQEFSEMYPELDQDKIESCLLIIKKQLDTIINVNALFFRDKVKFINSLKSTTTTIMLKEKLYQDLKLNKNFDKLLLLVYNNVTLLK